MKLIYLAIIISIFSCTKPTLTGHWKCDKTGFSKALNKKKEVRSASVTEFYDLLKIRPIEFVFSDDGKAKSISTKLSGKVSEVSLTVSPKRNCRLVALKMVKTVNGVQVPRYVPTITLQWPLQIPSGMSNCPNRRFVELYNIASNPQRHMLTHFEHQVIIRNPAPAGDFLMIMVFPGTDSGPMKGRISEPINTQPIEQPPSPIASIQSTDCLTTHHSVNFQSRSDRYYQTFYSGELCNNYWLPCQFGSDWVLGSGSEMQLRTDLETPVSVQSD